MSTSYVSYAGPEVDLLNGSTLENLTLGCDEIDLLRLHKCLWIAEVDGNLIMDNYKCTSFSNGQIHRLKIARALYKNSPVLLIDEFDSYLEDEIVQKILESLSKEKTDKIIILIGHNCKSELFDYIFDTDSNTFMKTVEYI